MEGCATLVHWDEVRPSATDAYRRALGVIKEDPEAAADDGDIRASLEKKLKALSTETAERSKK